MEENSLTVTPVADRKFGKFYEQVFEPACKAAGMNDHRFQLLLEQEKDIQVRTRVEKLFRELDDEVMESETIFVNYKVNTIIAAFKANKFGDKRVNLDLATIKVAGNGKVNHRVFEWYPNRIVYNYEIWPNLKKVKPGYKFADFLTPLKYALKLSDFQLLHPLVILFEHHGELCHLVLGRGGGKRFIDVSPDNLGSCWNVPCHFLFVRE